MTRGDGSPALLDAATLRERLGSDRPPRVLDVRSPAEFETVHVPGSYNVPLDLLREHREELLRHLDDEVVLLCRSGQRSVHAERTLAAAGLEQVHVLDGGILAWEASGGPVERGAPRWDLERQVRLVAGGLVVAGILGSLVAPQLKWLSGAIGGGLTVAALTNTCAMGSALARLPYNRGASCDLDTVVAQLAGADRTR